MTTMRGIRWTVLAAALCLALAVPVSAAHVDSPAQSPMKDGSGQLVTSMIEDCPFYPCANFITECENPGGTILFLDPVTECNFFNDTYTLYQGMCQFPPATFWDEVCFQ